MRRGKRRKRSQYSSGLSFYEDPKTVNLKTIREVLLWILTTAAALALAVICWRYFGLRVRVMNSSMEPGITAGQSVLVNRLSYQFGSPERGDVIAFYPGGNEEIQISVKRVVAIPGDTVQVVDGVLLVNGIPCALQESYSSIEDEGTAGNLITLEDEEYFVMGDNPQESEDSRSAGIGTVGEEDIIGTVWLALPGGGAGLTFIE